MCPLLSRRGRIQTIFLECSACYCVLLIMDVNRKTELHKHSPVLNTHRSSAVCYHKANATTSVSGVIFVMGVSVCTRHQGLTSASSHTQESFLLPVIVTLTYGYTTPSRVRLCTFSAGKQGMSFSVGKMVLRGKQVWFPELLFSFPKMPVELSDLLPLYKK